MFYTLPIIILQDRKDTFQEHLNGIYPTKGEYLVDLVWAKEIIRVRH